MSLGRFAIISDLSHLGKFKNYCFLGNIGEGLKWVKENNILAIEKAKRGVKFIQNNYDVPSISKEWKKIIEQTLEK